MVIYEWLYEPGTGDTDLKRGAASSWLCKMDGCYTVGFFQSPTANLCRSPAA